MASSHANPIDGLGDLSSGSVASSIASNASLRPTFEQLNATLLSRGYISSPLSVAGMHSESVNLLANALHSLIAQREHDAEFSQALAAKNRTLTAALERNARFLKEERQAKVDAERKEEMAKAKTANLTAQLQSLENEARQTREDLAKARRELATVKASAAQLRVASERGIERLRTRFGEGCTNALRGSLPSVRILDGVFAESSSRGATANGIERRQIEELEMRRAELTASNTALRRFATEAVNAARNAACRLEDLVEIGEEGSDSKLSPTGKAPSPSQRGPLYQRDLFPVVAPFAGSAAESNAHPAWQALHSAVNAIQSHTTALDAQRLALGRTHAEALRSSQAETADAKFRASLGASTSSSSSSGDGSSSATPSNEALAADYKSSAFGAARGPRSDADHRIQLELKLQDAVARLNKAETECNAAKEAAKRAEKSERALRKAKGVESPISAEHQEKEKEEAARLSREREEERLALEAERARVDRLVRETEAEREALERDVAGAQELKLQAQAMLEAASRSVEAARKAGSVAEQEESHQEEVSVSEAGTVIDHDPTPPAPIRTFRRTSARLSSGSTIGATSMGTIGSSVIPEDDVKMVDGVPATASRPASRASRRSETSEVADSTQASSSRGRKRRYSDEAEEHGHQEPMAAVIEAEMESTALQRDEGFVKPRARPTLVPRRPQPRSERQSTTMAPPSSTSEEANDENVRPRSTSGGTARRPRKGLMAPTASSMARATPSSRKVVEAMEPPQRGPMTTTAAAAASSVKRPRTLGVATAALGKLVNGAESSAARRQR